MSNDKRSMESEVIKDLFKSLKLFEIQQKISFKDFKLS